ncbi:unnamed protein product [Amoebophrya sp. A120]|nr:unnamed protein product [Amoebophrya sp. A120]|eukprot:GSA120T00004901001.1
MFDFAAKFFGNTLDAKEVVEQQKVDEKNAQEVSNPQVEKHTTLFVGTGGTKTNANGVVVNAIQGKVGFIEVRLFEIIDSPMQELFVDFATMQRPVDFSGSPTWVVGNMARTRLIRGKNLGRIQMKPDKLLLCIPVEGYALLRVRLWSANYLYIGQTTILFYRGFQVSTGEPISGVKGYLCTESACDGIPSEFSLPENPRIVVEDYLTDRANAANPRARAEGGRPPRPESLIDFIEGTDDDARVTRQTNRTSRPRQEQTSGRVTEEYNLPMRGQDSISIMLSQEDERHIAEAVQEDVDSEENNDPSLRASSCRIVENKPKLTALPSQKTLPDHVLGHTKSGILEGGIESTEDLAPAAKPISEGVKPGAIPSLEISSGAMLEGDDDSDGLEDADEADFDLFLDQEEHDDLYNLTSENFGDILDPSSGSDARFNDLAEMFKLPSSSTDMDEARANYSRLWEEISYWRDQQLQKRRAPTMYRIACLGGGVCGLSLQIRPILAQANAASDRLDAQDFFVLLPETMKKGRMIVRDDAFERLMQEVLADRFARQPIETGFNVAVKTEAVGGENEKPKPAAAEGEALPQEMRSSRVSADAAGVDVVAASGARALSSSSSTAVVHPLMKEPKSSAPGAPPQRKSQQPGAVAKGTIISGPSPAQAGLTGLTVLSREIDGSLSSASNAESATSSLEFRPPNRLNGSNIKGQNNYRNNDGMILAPVDREAFGSGTGTQRRSTPLSSGEFITAESGGSAISFLDAQPRARRPTRAAEGEGTKKRELAQMKANDATKLGREYDEGLDTLRNRGCPQSLLSLDAVEFAIRRTATTNLTGVQLLTFATNAYHFLPHLTPYAKFRVFEIALDLQFFPVAKLILLKTRTFPELMRLKYLIDTGGKRNLISSIDLLDDPTKILVRHFRVTARKYCTGLFGDKGLKVKKGGTHVRILPQFNTVLDSAIRKWSRTAPTHPNGSIKSEDRTRVLAQHLEKRRIQDSLLDTDSEEEDVVANAMIPACRDCEVVMQQKAEELDVKTVRTRHLKQTFKTGWKGLKGFFKTKKDDGTRTEGLQEGSALAMPSGDEVVESNYDVVDAKASPQRVSLSLTKEEKKLLRKATREALKKRVRDENNIYPAAEGEAAPAPASIKPGDASESSRDVDKRTEDALAFLLDDEAMGMGLTSQLDELNIDEKAKEQIKQKLRQDIQKHSRPSTRPALTQYEKPQPKLLNNVILKSGEVILLRNRSLICDLVKTYCFRQVISDIDQTFLITPHGINGPEMPLGTVPGCRTLYNMLAPMTVFLSIRPDLDMMAQHTRLNLQENAKLYGGDYGLLLAGNATSVTNYLAGNNMQNGVRKFEVFRKHLRAYPESDFFLFGDSGEGDLRLMQECGLLERRSLASRRFRNQRKRGAEAVRMKVDHHLSRKNCYQRLDISKALSRTNYVRPESPKTVGTSGTSSRPSTRQVSGPTGAMTYQVGEAPPENYLPAGVQRKQRADREKDMREKQEAAAKQDRERRTKKTQVIEQNEDPGFFESIFGATSYRNEKEQPRHPENRMKKRVRGEGQADASPAASDNEFSQSSSDPAEVDDQIDSETVPENYSSELSSALNSDESAARNRRQNLKLPEGEAYGDSGRMSARPTPGSRRAQGGTVRVGDSTRLPERREFWDEEPEEIDRSEQTQLAQPDSFQEVIDRRPARRRLHFFIRDVTEPSGVRRITPMKERARLFEESHVLVVNNSIEAALYCYEHLRILSKPQLRKIAVDTLNELVDRDWVKFLDGADGPQNTAVRQARVAEFQTVLRKVNNVLTDGELIRAMTTDGQWRGEKAVPMQELDRLLAKPRK